MIYFTVKIDANTSEWSAQQEKAIQKAQYALDSQVLKDSNYFIPKDTGNLEQSSLRASDIGGGLIRWDTPYARRLYYHPEYNFQKDENPNARGLWFEEAKARYATDWEHIAQHTFNENF